MVNGGLTEEEALKKAIENSLQSQNPGKEVWKEVIEISLQSQIPEENHPRKHAYLEGIIDLGTAGQHDCLLLCLIYALRLAGRMSGSIASPILTFMLDFPHFREIKPKGIMAEEVSLQLITINFNCTLRIHRLQKVDGILSYAFTEDYGNGDFTINFCHDPTRGSEHYMHGIPPLGSQGIVSQEEFYSNLNFR